ncbi:helix-turn-helix domain-containing protein [Saccharomonospora piscinae]|uniref:Transcriptional regulator n=1 Tax=Saccharomonospora piscinae TaxID=687388 RepID=A0A1V9AAD0_SACPI|nr:helix-turn-helix transcriptional regulator [Saccharomonospora piscinae]OQO94082.1 transcriptional regulator [Saccharomonospora piscinae]TLW95256.1 helix-turn-helix transcriptional regulator [Saccharomonospora piscinae]
MTVLLREAIGDRLRHARTTKRRTLRDISRAAKVSLGYLSEVERGQKEASSELLASICEALDLPLGELLHHVAADVSALDRVEVGVDAGHATPAPAAAASPASEGDGAPVAAEQGFEGGRLVAGTQGNDLADLRLAPALRTTIRAPKSKAVLAA